MRHYSKLRAIFASFYSADLYRDIRIRWDGLGITYLFFLHVILITPAIILLIWMLDSALFGERNGRTLARNITDEIITQMPTLAWDDKGQLSLPDGDEKRVVHFTYMEEQIPFLRIALDDQATDVGNEKEFMLLTRNGVHFKKSGDEIETRRWSDMFDEPITLAQGDMRTLGDRGLMWLDDNRSTLYVGFGVFAWAFTILALFIYRMFVALIYGAIGLGICSILKTKIDYYTLVRMATVALTPAMLFNLILHILIGEGISLPMSILVNTGYLYFAIHANRNLTPQG